jgi:hypothetical protein
MHFKQFILLSESLNKEIEDFLLNVKNIDKVEMRKFIDELKASPEEIDKKAAFAKMQEKFGFAKKKNLPDPPKNPALQSYYDNLVDGKITIPEYKIAAHYQNAAGLSEIMSSLRRLVNQGIVNLQYKDGPEIIYGDESLRDFADSTKFAASIHKIESQAGLAKKEIKGGTADPYLLQISNEADQVWPPAGTKDNPSNIYVFKAGFDPQKCRLMGKGQVWCISSSHFKKWTMAYRINRGQVQYFIFDLNKDKDDPTRYVNAGVAESEEAEDEDYDTSTLMGGEWVDARNHPDEIEGYSSVEEYERYLASKGVPVEKVFVPEPLSDDEKKLKTYLKQQNWKEAKALSTELWEAYILLSDRLPDEAYNTLSEEQKTTFRHGKLQTLTTKQISDAVGERKNNKRNFKEWVKSLLLYDMTVEDMLGLVPENEQYEFMDEFLGSVQDGTLTKLLSHGLRTINNKQFSDLLIKHSEKFDNSAYIDMLISKGITEFSPENIKVIENMPEYNFGNSMLSLMPDKGGDENSETMFWSLVENHADVVAKKLSKNKILYSNILNLFGDYKMFTKFFNAINPEIMKYLGGKIESSLDWMSHSDLKNLLNKSNSDIVKFIYDNTNEYTHRKLSPFFDEGNNDTAKLSHLKHAKYNFENGELLNGILNSKNPLSFISDIGVEKFRKLLWYPEFIVKAIEVLNRTRSISQNDIYDLISTETLDNLGYEDIKNLLKKLHFDQMSESKLVDYLLQRLIGMEVSGGKKIESSKEDRIAELLNSIHSLDNSLSVSKLQKLKNMAGDSVWNNIKPQAVAEFLLRLPELRLNESTINEIANLFNLQSLESLPVSILVKLLDKLPNLNYTNGFYQAIKNDLGSYMRYMPPFVVLLLDKAKGKIVLSPAEIADLINKKEFTAVETIKRLGKERMTPQVVALLKPKIRDYYQSDMLPRM